MILGKILRPRFRVGSNYTVNKKLLFLIILSIAFPVLAIAATHNAGDCAVSTIQTIIDDAGTLDGDIINIPVGNCNWTTTLTIDKSIELIGAGIGQTNITQTGADGEIEIANATDDFRISGFSFIVTNTSYDRYNIWIGTSHTHDNVDWRIDHNRFIGYHYSILVYGYSFGVIDNNDFYGGGIEADSDGATAWTASTGLGGANFIFIEDNYFTDQDAISQPTNAIIANWGTRFVFRHNDVLMDATSGSYYGGGGVDAHGY